MTDEHVEGLGRLLNVGMDEARCLSEQIARAVATSRREGEARRHVPDITKARTRLDKIAKVSRELARLLAEDDAAAELLRGEASPLYYLTIRLTDRSADQEEGALATFVEQARTIERTSLALLNDEDRLRAVYRLPYKGEERRSPWANGLWLCLFSIWEDAGRPVAMTEGGPLHRFLSFVHQAHELPAVEWSTFRDAAKRWKEDGQRAEIEDEQAL